MRELTTRSRPRRYRQIVGAKQLREESLNSGPSRALARLCSKQSELPLQADIQRWNIQLLFIVGTISRLSTEREREIVSLNNHQTAIVQN